MSNWLYRAIKKAGCIKVSSITFAPLDSHKISQPKTIFDIGNIMWYWAAKNVPEEYKPPVPEWVAMDGFDTHKTTGIINWYLPPDINPELILTYINECAYTELAPLNIRVGQITLDKSGMFGIPVYRVRIIKNETVDRPQVPELNVSNMNAVNILNVLELPTDWQGQIDAQDLLRRVGTALVDMNTVPRYSPNEYEPEEDQSYMIRVLNKLQEIAQWTIQNMPHPIIVWN